MESQPLGGDGANKTAAAPSSCRSSAFVAAGARSRRSSATKRWAVPEDLVGKRESYVLRVKGTRLSTSRFRDGDFVIVEDRRTADNGEMVIAMVNRVRVTLKEAVPRAGAHPAAARRIPRAADHRSRRSGRGFKVSLSGVMRRY